MKEKGILFIIFGLIFIGGALLIAGDSIPLPSQDPRYDVDCQVTISNAPLRDVQIDSVSCDVKRASLFSLSNFYSLYDTGNLVMTAQGKQAVRSYKVVEVEGSYSWLCPPLCAQSGKEVLEIGLSKLEGGQTPFTFYVMDDEQGEIDRYSLTLNLGGT